MDDDCEKSWTHISATGEPAETAVALTPAPIQIQITASDAPPVVKIVSSAPPSVVNPIQTATSTAPSVELIAALTPKPESGNVSAAPPISAAQPPISAAQPPISAAQPPISAAQPSISAAQKTFSQITATAATPDVKQAPIQQSAAPVDIIETAKTVKAVVSSLLSAGSLKPKNKEFKITDLVAATPQTKLTPGADGSVIVTASDSPSAYQVMYSLDDVQLSAGFRVDYVLETEGEEFNVFVLKNGEFLPQKSRSRVRTLAANQKHNGFLEFEGPEAGSCAFIVGNNRKPVGAFASIPSAKATIHNITVHGTSEPVVAPPSSTRITAAPPSAAVANATITATAPDSKASSIQISASGSPCKPQPLVKTETISMAQFLNEVTLPAIHVTFIPSKSQHRAWLYGIVERGGDDIWLVGLNDQNYKLQRDAQTTWAFPSRVRLEDRQWTDDAKQTYVVFMLKTEFELSDIRTVTTLDANERKTIKREFTLTVPGSRTTAKFVQLLDAKEVSMVHKMYNTMVNQYNRQINDHTAAASAKLWTDYLVESYLRSGPNIRYKALEDKRIKIYKQDEEEEDYSLHWRDRF